MQEEHPVLSSDSYQMLISSVTQKGNAPLQPIEAERLLNAIARVQSGVPTGAQGTNGHS